MVRTLSNRDKQICFLSTEANSILEICFWKHLRYEVLEQDSGYRGRRCEGQMRLEELDKDRADDKKKKKNSSNHGPVQDHQNNNSKKNLGFL